MSYDIIAHRLTITPNFQIMEFPEYITRIVTSYQRNKNFSSIHEEISVNVRSSAGLYANCVICGDFIVKHSHSQKDLIRTKHQQIVENGYQHMIPETFFLDELIVQRYVKPVLEIPDYKINQETLFQILDFCIVNKTGDIHSGNYGISEDGVTPQIFDFAGYGTNFNSWHDFSVGLGNCNYDERVGLSNLGHSYIAGRYKGMSHMEAMANALDIQTP